MTLLLIIFYLIVAYLLWNHHAHWAVIVYFIGIGISFLIEGYSWQSVPFYMFVWIPLVLFWQPDIPRWAVGMLHVGMLLGFMLSGILHLALPEFDIPAPTGSHAAGITEYHGTNGATAKIWYPATVQTNDSQYRYLSGYQQPLMGLLPAFTYSHLKNKATFAYEDARASNGRFPVIIYEHGADGFVEENTFLLTDLASHGYVVIGVVHDKRLNEYGLDFANLSAEPRVFLQAMRDVVMSDRLQELTAVVESLEELNQDNLILENRLDLSQLNFLGYSLGGGLVTDYCVRMGCRTVVNLDGNPFIEAHKHGVQSPYLHMSQNELLLLAENEATTAKMSELYQQDVQQVVHQTQESGYVAHWLLLNDSGHASFTDLSYWVGIRWGMVSSLFGTVETDASHHVIQTTIKTFLENPEAVEAIYQQEELLFPFPHS